MLVNCLIWLFFSTYNIPLFGILLCQFFSILDNTEKNIFHTHLLSFLPKSRIAGLREYIFLKFLIFFTILSSRKISPITLPLATCEEILTSSSTRSRYYQLVLKNILFKKCEHLCPGRQGSVVWATTVARISVVAISEQMNKYQIQIQKVNKTMSFQCSTQTKRNG